MTGRFAFAPSAFCMLPSISPASELDTFTAYSAPATLYTWSGSVNEDTTVGIGSSSAGAAAVPPRPSSMALPSARMSLTVRFVPFMSSLPPASTVAPESITASLSLSTTPTATAPPNCVRWGSGSSGSLTAKVAVTVSRSPLGISLGTV